MAQMKDGQSRGTRAKVVKGFRMKRIYTTPGVHPYDEVEWDRRDVLITNWRDGSVNFEQRGVEFPSFWQPNAIQIVASKYFRGALGTPQREWSLRQLIDRVVGTYVRSGRQNGYFSEPEDAEIFEHEMTYTLLHQIFSFNSPVWFNVGTAAPHQVSACFLLAVDDSMDSILDWYKEEGLIFKGGSGSGVNLSRIRWSKELLSSGGNASGPVSFMRGADASAGTIKSGGATRRAAKMVILDINHPDIEEFIQTKVREEAKIRVLRDAGFDMDLGGDDIYSVQYQNANNSVRVTDEFMRQLEADGEFSLTTRLTGEVIETVKARDLWTQMCQAAWECADPGIQYDDTINDWHTCPESGRITTSNPCAEYLHLDNSSCNLASINLLKFLHEDNKTFDVAKFTQVCELVITAMDISICFADFPTAKIGEVTRAFRQLGMGYANLGALLMATGLPYDSDGGRALAGAITSLMTATAYRRSAELAGVVGSYDGYPRNTKGHKRIMRKHQAASRRQRSSTRVTGRCGQLRRPNGTSACGSASATVGGMHRRRYSRPLGHPGSPWTSIPQGLSQHWASSPSRSWSAAARCSSSIRPRSGRSPLLATKRSRSRRSSSTSPSTGTWSTPRSPTRALSSLRLRDGRAFYRPDGACADDGRGAAVPERIDIEDGESAGVGDGRGHRVHLPGGMEARAQGAGRLPGQLQGRPAAV